MNRNRIRVVVLSLAAAVALYALLGFLLVPYAAKNFLVSFVERDLGHKLTLGEVRFNPFTFKAELADLDLREPAGGAMFACSNLWVDFEAASLWRRAWTFADIAAQAPALHFELRPNGRHNFSALLDALRDPKPQPDKAPPALAIQRIAIEAGRVDLADPQAGETARLTLAPIAFEITELTTEASDSAPYKLTARSPDGERIEWNGEVSVNPAASKGRLVLQGWNFSTIARWLGSRIALARADGTFDLSLDYDGAYAGGTAAFALSNLEARVAGLALVNRAASEPFARLESLLVTGGALDLASRKLTLERVEIARAALALQVGTDGSFNWSSVIPRAPEKPDPASNPEPASRLASGPNTEPAPAGQAETPAAAAAQDPPWSGRVGRLVVADSAFSYADGRAESAAEIALAGIRFETSADATQSGAASAITLSKIDSAIGKLALRTRMQRLEVTQASLKAAGLSAKQDGNGTELGIHAIDAATASMVLQQGDDRWQVGKAGAAMESVRVSASDGSGARIEGAGFSSEANAIAAQLGKAAKNAIEVGSATARARTFALEAGTAAPNVRIEGLGSTIQAVLVRDPSSGNELARLARAELEGAAATTAEQTVSVEKVTVTEAHAAVVLGADGKSNWDVLVAAFGAGEAPAQAKPAAEAAPWNAVAKVVDLGNLSGVFTDRRQDPPLSLELQQVNARASNASTDRATPMQVELGGRIQDGGQFNVAGRVNALTPAADLKVKLSGVSLLPLQPYAARYARVQIVSALASADGRLRYGYAKAAGADLVFEGELGLDKVIVEETEPAQPLLSVETLRSAQTRLTLGPDRLEIPDLRLDKLATRLLIAQDQSVNIAKLLRRKAQTAASGQPPAAPEAKAPAGGEGSDADPFPVEISRVRLDNSVLEFSDLSLTPQFNTRMHELQGVITGISTSANTTARMELDARVDEFGSAQIRGIMNLFKPKVFTNVNLVFRNLEMTDLTPYAAKFAGYRIASGKLSMDLHYRIKNSALVGENKIVVEKLELGERVESPTALDLPLELAIAILKDDKGRIDIGLPVSGSLDDPQFSIAAVVWKALGNLLGRIVTAPFRALAGLFGAGSNAEELGSIEFDPGLARIAPPQRQKLQTVAEALAKRPELKLRVKPAYAPQADREALQSAAVRREVLARAGIKLDPGEAPGPLDYGNAGIRRAIEDLFTEAFGFPAARDLRANLPKRATQSEPQAATAAKPEQAAGDTKPAAEAAGENAKPAEKPPEASTVRVARAMARRLIGARPVEDTALTGLAQQRGEAIATTLRAAAKIDPARVTTAPPHAIDGDSARVVETTLELDVIK